MGETHGLDDDEAAVASARAAPADGRGIARLRLEQTAVAASRAVNDISVGWSTVAIGCADVHSRFLRCSKAIADVQKGHNERMLTGSQPN